MCAVAIRRFSQNPIITPPLNATLGTNINGPSLIRVPNWLQGALGRYYLYFAHHQGKHIRLAYADRLEGPWTVHEPGVLSLEESLFVGHVASPDVHIDLLNEGKHETRSGAQRDGRTTLLVRLRHERVRQRGENRTCGKSQR